MNKEKIIVVILLILMIWFGFTIVRLENFHYASQVGFCNEFLGIENLSLKNNCLEKTQTRTNSFWHLLYGLRILK